VPGAVVEGDALVGDVSHFSIGFTGIPIPEAELCDDRLDNDFDGLTDCDDGDCTRVPSCETIALEDCSNGVDDDRDLFVDCEDNDCIGASGCGVLLVELCDNRIDDDADGMTDCVDSDCSRDPFCGPASEICDDGIDNDSNRFADCADPACVGAAACGDEDAGVDGSGDAGVDAETDTGSGGTGRCLNPADQAIFGTADVASASRDCGLDCFLAPEPAVCAAACVESATGLTSGCASCHGAKAACLAANCLSDCTTDPSGVACETCQLRFCAVEYDLCSGAGGGESACADGLDNDLNGAADCYDLRCPRAINCVSREGNCTDGLDNDGDRLFDCADGDCAGDPRCAGESDCSNGFDDDGDGLTDCADVANCASDPTCFEFVCDNFLDDDGDGRSDCLDADCNGLPQCQEFCEDGIDNDGDGQVDCFDGSCRGTPACPQQRCAGLGTFAYDAGNGLFFSGFGASMTPCADGEGCSLLAPPTELPVAGALVPTYEGVCAPRLADGAACTADPADGFCETSRFGGAGCVEGLCRREGTVCEAGESPAWRLDFLGDYTPYCVPSALVAATGEACGTTVGAYCGRADDLCTDSNSLVTTDAEGLCLRQVSFPSGCPAGTRFGHERNDGDGRRGLCLPVVGAGAPCSATALCDELENLVCGSGGTCRTADAAEACNTASELLTNTSGVGPDLFAVDRLDGRTASDESLYCSGTVGPEKVYVYLATAPVELAIEVGSVDGNGPRIAWHARTDNCTDIFEEAACGDASLLPTRGKVQLLAGETVYLIVDSEARWDGGDSAAAEFFIAVGERPVASVGESCADAVCKAGSNCAVTGFCSLPACGDGVVDSAERCDDGNSVPGDGCIDCNIETLSESEPNNILAEADAVGTARRVVGSSNYESDYYCFDVGPLGGRVGVRPERVEGNCDLYREGVGWLSCGVLNEVSFATQNGCFFVYSNGETGYAFEVTIDPFESLEEGAACGPSALTGAVCTDMTGAPGVCRETSPRLQLGVCDTTSCGDGYLDRSAGEVCDDGNTAAGDGCDASCLREVFAEVEPNNGTITARNLNGYRKITGTLSTTSDQDYFKLTLTQRSHLEFDLDAAAFPSSSNSFGLQLLSSTAAVLYNGSLDTYYGRSGARGGPQQADAGSMLLEQELAFLEPGTYTIRLSAAAAATGDYTLLIREVPTSVVAVGGGCDPASYKPCLDGLVCSILSSTCAIPLCGDGDVTVGEVCDDGNLENGDGCSADCAVEGSPATGVSAVSDTATPLVGGARYTFEDGSEARAISLVGPWTGDDNRYLLLQIDKPTRIRAINAAASYSRFRIWKAGLSSPYSSEGTQIAGFDLRLVSYPTWFAATTPADPNAVTCDNLAADGICTSFGDGTDCMDCGARYASTPTSFYGYEGRLAPGAYIVELRAYDIISPLWLFLGESPSERRTFP
jgi:cysteine-rich repeat protein